ncbi:DUF6316 family protein [Aliikangiella coralliicola]|uniref:DUF6316 family protein n=1 Tax=Aliikangiella coralliicola TaxID=2592383 RepID=UPI00143D9E1A|nr:DUF6316 family protein [Aliikangiella coralliicola]
MRRDDKKQYQFNRSERFYVTDSGWYFTIRQGAAFGPYESRNMAVKGLNAFIDLLKA